MVYLCEITDRFKSCFHCVWILFVSVRTSWLYTIFLRKIYIICFKHSYTRGWYILYILYVKILIGLLNFFYCFSISSLCTNSTRKVNFSNAFHKCSRHTYTVILLLLVRHLKDWFLEKLVIMSSALHHYLLR